MITAMRTSRITAIVSLVVGMAFVIIGLTRPGFFWDTGKVRAGRELVGDAGVTAFFVALGAILVFVGRMVARQTQGRK
jgi:hypothetical protein